MIRTEEKAMKAYRNVNIYLQNNGICQASIRFDDCIREIAEPQAGDEILSLPQDAVVLPGFVDSHVHGAGGADACDGTQDALQTIAQTLAKEGTTSFLATTMTIPETELVKALEAVRDYRASAPTDGARCVGVHLEGPFIAEAFCGAQDPAAIAKPDAALFDKLYHASGDAFRIVTVAPEVPEMLSLIDRAVQCGVSVGIGHTAAGEEEIRAAMQHGADGITHTYNAQSKLHHRQIGAVGMALLEDGLYTELIADTFHVTPSAMKLLIKCKPHDRMILITDAMRAKSTTEEVSDLGGQTVYVKDGQARLADGTLAGSVLKMNVAIRNAVKILGVSLEDASDFASANPAARLGLSDKIGGIAVGKAADFVVLDRDFEVLQTVRDGKVIFAK